MRCGSWWEGVGVLSERCTYIYNVNRTWALVPEKIDKQYGPRPFLFSQSTDHGATCTDRWTFVLHTTCARRCVAMGFTLCSLGILPQIEYRLVNYHMREQRKRKRPFALRSRTGQCDLQFVGPLESRNRLWTVLLSSAITRSVVRETEKLPLLSRDLHEWFLRDDRKSFKTGKGIKRT